MKEMKPFRTFLRNNYIVIIGIIVIYLVDFIIILQTKGMTTPVDEVGMFAVAAKLAGYNWSEVVAESGYYGFGYFALFAPIFKYIKNPDVVHQIILSTNSLLKIAVIPIIYNVQIKFLHVANRKFAATVAIMLSVINISLRSRPYNEFPLHLLIWIDMWLLCKLISVYNNEKKKRLYSFLFVLTLVYGLLIHVRAVTIIYAMCITIVALYFITHKCYINMSSVLIGLVLWAATNQLIEKVQNIVWATSGDELGNTAVKLTSQISFFNPRMYLLWFDIILGNIGMMLIQTGGILAIVAIAFIFKIVNVIKKKFVEEDIYLFSMSFSMFLCMGATLLALMLSGWYGGMTATFFEGIQGTSVYAYKGMVYLRYWGIYISPFIMCGLVLLDKYKWWKKAYAKAVFLSVIIIGLFLTMVLPWIENNANCLIFIQSLAGWKKGDTCDRNSYLLSCMTVGITLSILAIWINKKRQGLAMLLFAVFFLYQQIWSSLYFDIPTTHEIYELIDASVERLNNLEEGEFPKRIFALEFDEERDASYKQSLSLQYYFMNHTIHTDIPMQFQKGDLIITREEIQDERILNHLSDVKYDIEQIDKDEFWYIIMGA